MLRSRAELQKDKRKFAKDLRAHDKPISKEVGLFISQYIHDQQGPIASGTLQPAFCHWF